MRARRNDSAAVALVREVAAVLAAHGDVACRPAVEEEDGCWTLTVAFTAGDDPTKALEILELATALARVRDVAQMRGFAATYDIAPERIEALLGTGPLRIETSGDDRVREISAEIVEKFRCFGGGDPANRAGDNPIARAFKDGPPMFAGGVDVAQVVRFVLERLEVGDGRRA